MVQKRKLFTPWSSLDNMLGRPPAWLPPEDQQRIQAYEKYDQLYWNDPTQYAIRILENEQPLYVPNARTIVDTTATYLMKGLQLITAGSDVIPRPDTAEPPATMKDDPRSPAQKSLDDFLRRERFYSKFNINKQAGITRGDFAFHVTADPTKEPGSRISVDTLHPGQVRKITDPEDPDKVIRIHIFELFTIDDEEFVRKLTYSKVNDKGDPLIISGKRRISREEALFKLVGDRGEWYGPTPEKVKTFLPLELLPEQVTQFPVYWFNNIEWESQLYGSSDLRGLEFLDWAVSQGTTDVQMALALQGLGVYATDGGRPVDDEGGETDWEVAPGKVMEVPTGSYFRRVEGVGSITPAMDQIKYLEQKMYAATGMTDVALGQVDVQVAQSGIALAIKFMPTLARVEPRDTACTEILQQMFFDLQGWFQVYEGFNLPEVDVKISGNKLPQNAVDILNQLNNMLDRNIISRAHYRREAIRLGYNIPDGIEAEIQKEREADAKIAAASAPPGLQQNAQAAAAGRKPFTSANGSNTDNVDKQPNQSNNQSRPNESSGTEATQTAARQARG